MIRAVLDANVIVSGVILAFVARLHRHSQVTPGRLQVRVIAEDPDDNAVLACAKEGDAAYIVTGDGHLLSLGAYEGIPIVTPVQFLRALAERQR